jgi:hypothetical protein
MNGKRIALWLALGLLLAASACSTQSPVSQGTAVRPLAEILASGPTFTGITSDRATLLLSTSIPVVCAVVYGSTHAYGQIATDSDMAGGAHENHHPLLTGLEPDTLYYARVQGVAADGAVYRSEEYTFRTPAAGTGAQPKDLALPENGGRVVGVSSNYGGGGNDSTYGASNAIDGNPATEWSSNGDGDKAWIEIELAAATHVTRIGFWTRTMGATGQIESFQIVTGSGETVGPFQLTGATRAELFDTDFVAGRLRFEVVKSSGGNTGAVEIEVYGQPE